MADHDEARYLLSLYEADPRYRFTESEAWKLAAAFEQAERERDAFASALDHERSFAEALVGRHREALEWLVEFANKMLDVHLGFVYVERKARAALTTPESPPVEADPKEEG